MTITKKRNANIKYRNFRGQIKSAIVYHYVVNNKDVWYITRNKESVRFLKKPLMNVEIREGSFTSSNYNDLQKVARKHNLQKIMG